MRPKFEWITNIVFVLLTLAIGAIIVYLCQFALGQVVLGIIFYGGIGYLIFSAYSHPKRKKPRRISTKRGFISSLGAAIGLLAVLLVGAYLFS